MLLFHSTTCGEIKIVNTDKMARKIVNIQGQQGETGKLAVNLKYKRV